MCGAALAAKVDDPSALGLAASGAVFVGDDAQAATLFARAIARACADGAVDALPCSWPRWQHSRCGPVGTRRRRPTRRKGSGSQRRPDRLTRPPITDSVLAWIAAVQGKEQDCRDAAAAASSRAIAHRLGPQAAIAAWAVALLDVGMGRPVEAFERLDALTNAGPGEGHQMVKVFAAADLVEVAVRTGQAGKAQAALGSLEAWAAHSGVPWAAALVARCRGLLSDGDHADEHFERALALHARSGRPFDAARTELVFGETLRRRRRRTQARTHLRAACEGFEGLGAVPWAEQARVELRATGETARRRHPGTVHQLTPQELQIVRLVGGGGTNREIAAQLFLSPRTVDYHLHKVFTKLGMSSRAELVRLAASDGFG